MQHTLHSDGLLMLGIILAGVGACMILVNVFAWLYLMPDWILYPRLIAPINGGLYLSAVMCALGIIALYVYRHGERIWID